MVWRLAIVLASIVAGAASAQGSGTGDDRAERFLSGISDLPLMAALEQRPDTGFVFDKPDGRIVELVADGPVSNSAVADFYLAVLPEFGWRYDRQVDQPEIVGPGDQALTNRTTWLYFERDGERLRLAIAGARSTVTVRFSLTPRP
ncbi:MAG: hypothetical protein ACE5EM_03215 [Sphingomonadales bacterium]